MFFAYIFRCRNKHGGFGGGPGQIPHLAPTYAAVNSLCIIGTEESLEAINMYVVSFSQEKERALILN